MNVALEVSCLVARNQTGISRYARELALHLPHAMPKGDRLTLVHQLRRSHRRRLLPPGLPARPWHGGWLWPVPGATVVHATHRQLPPRRHGALHVATMHDLYAAVGVPTSGGGTDHEELAYYAAAVGWADHVICVSENTRRDLLQHLALDPARSSVVPLGVAPDFHPRPEPELARFRVAHALQRPYLLFVGNVHPNKNLERTLQAFRTVRNELDFVIIGRARGDAETTLAGWIAENGLAGSVRVLGRLGDDELALAYAAAAALVFPSLYEGFGMPILEAMASGVPVVTSRTGSCPEAAAGHAALVDPYAPESIAAGITEALGFDAAQREAARRYASAMTWQRTAQATLAVYGAAGARPASG